MKEIIFQVLFLRFRVEVRSRHGFNRGEEKENIREMEMRGIGDCYR